MILFHLQTLGEGRQIHFFLFLNNKIFENIFKHFFENLTFFNLCCVFLTGDRSKTQKLRM